MPPSVAEPEIVRDLALLRVAKDVFLSPWYADASSALFKGRALETLGRIAEESKVERERTFALIDDWDAAGEDAAGRRAVAAAVVHDFLQVLTEIKQSSAEVYHRAAMAAPEHLRGEFLELAAIDVKHAMLLHDLIAEEFRDPRRLLP